jgi:hypothetical protein
MARIFTREDLDALRCDECDEDDGEDDRVYFHARCHPRGRLWVAYQRGALWVDGSFRARDVAMLVVECAVCSEEVLRIALPD